MRWARDKFGVKWFSKERNPLGAYASICSPFGLWPVEEDNVFLRIRWFISMFTLSVLVLQAIYESYLNCIDIENNADNLYSITFGIIGLSKLFFYYKYRDVLRTNIESAVDDWCSEDAQNFESIMSGYRNNYEKTTKYYLIFGFIICNMYIIKVLLIDPDVTIIVKNEKNVTTALKLRFLLPAACTLNDVSQSFYWTIFGFQLFPFFVAVGVNLGCDAFLIAISGHLCAQLELLKIKFSNFTNSKNDMEIREEIGLLIARHSHLLKLAKQLETASSMILFIQIIMNIFILNVAGFNLLIHLKKKKMFSAMTNASLIAWPLVQTFGYSYIGDWITCQGNDIALSVYHCTWHSMPISVSKNLIFIMARAKYPIGLTAGNFLKMTRATFTGIVNTAFSYLSVLRIVIKDI